MTNFMAKAISLLLISMVISSPDLAQSAITCSQVTAALAPCIGYAIRGGPTVPLACCRGAQGLFNKAKTTPDLQQTCKCMKSIASGVPQSKFEYAAAILPKFGIKKAPFKISLATDCNRVHT